MKVLGTANFNVNDPDQTGTHFDDHNCHDHLVLLAAAHAARNMGEVADGYGFHDQVKKDVAIDLWKKTISLMMPYIYGYHINKAFADQGRPDLQQLR